MRCSGFRSLCLVLAAASAIASGCGGSKKKKVPSGQVPRAAKPERVSADRAAESGADLVRATQTPHHVLWQAVGPHRIEMKSTMKITGASAETLDEDFALAIDGNGAFTLLHNNSRDYGKDVVFVGPDLYIRPRYGKYVHRPAEQGEGERLRDETYGALAAYLEVVGFALEPRAEDVQVAGRAAKKLTLSLGAGKPASQPEAHPERKWRETVTPGVIDGVIVLDEKTAAPLSANLHIAYKFVRDGAPVEVDLTLTMDVKDIGTAQKIAAPAPEAFVEVPVRARPMVERDELLGKPGGAQ